MSTGIKERGKNSGSLGLTWRFKQINDQELIAHMMTNIRFDQVVKKEEISKSIKQNI